MVATYARRWGVAGLVVWTIACGSSGNSSGGSGGAGGVFGSGPLGSSTSIVGSSATTGSSATGGGTTGSSTTTGAGGSSNPDPGTFDSIWKRQSATLQIIDPANPVPTNQMVTLPATITEPVDGREIDVYQQIQNATLISYSYRTGDASYYRIQQAVSLVQDSYLLGVDGSTHMFSLQDGRLADQTSVTFGSAIAVSNAVYTKYSGPFPPTAWPAQVIDIK